MSNKTKKIIIPQNTKNINGKTAAAYKIEGVK